METSREHLRGGLSLWPLVAHPDSYQDLLFLMCYLTVCRRDAVVFFFSSRRRHTRYWRDWSSDVCSSDLFPLLGSVLAQDRFMPRQLHTRGDKLVYSNGILLLAGFAALLMVAVDADVNRLIQMYIVGVFTNFSIGQWGMVRHWNRELRTETDAAARARIRRSQTINAVGGTLTTVVLVIIIVTKFTRGAYLVLLVMPILFLLMRAINRHYSNVSKQLIPDTDSRTLPSKVHAIVLVSKVHKPTLRALAFARATRPDALTALTVNVDDVDTRNLQADWERYDIPVPLTVLESPYREITRPVVDYVKAVRRASPREQIGRAHV